MAENSKSRDNLCYLGPEFQYKLVRAFMDDHKFFVGINNIMTKTCLQKVHLELMLEC